MSLLEHLKLLAALPGGAGREEAVAQALAESLKDGASRVDVDPMGNLVATFGRGEASLLVLAHLDEVGLLVRGVEADGRLRLAPNGYIDARAWLAQPVEVHTDSGPVPGVVGVVGRHLLSDEEARRPLEVEGLWVEVGASSAEEALGLGIRIGDPVLAVPGLKRLAGGRILSKALDNRIGCALLVAIAEEIEPSGLDFTLYLAASVQEEIGSRGAKVLGESLRPSIALVFDTVSGVGALTEGASGLPRLGRGPVIRAADFMPDWVMGAHYSLPIRRRLKSLAEEAGIAYQEDVASTWTDAATLHLSGGGVPTGGLFVPRLHSHSPCEVADLGDIEAAARLALAFVTSLDAKGLEALRGGWSVGAP